MNTRTPALCGASWSDSSIWSMVAGGGPCDYAQSGYGRHQGESTVYYFSEYNYGNCSHDVFKEFGAASGTHTYTTQYNFSTGHMSMYLDSTTLDTTSFDPAVSWTPGWDGQFFGEVHDNGDDIAGSSANPIYFSGIRVITNRSSGWVIPGTLLGTSDSPRYGYSKDTSDKFHIWTK